MHMFLFDNHKRKERELNTSDVILTLEDLLLSEKIKKSCPTKNVFHS